MAVNKVVVNTENGAQVLVDLTGDTVTADKLFKGITAHDAAGNIITGALELVTPGYTNVLASAIDSDGTPYNGGQGWKAGYRLNSTGAEVALDGMYVTGFIPVKSGDVIRLSGITMQPKASATNYNRVYVWLYQSDFSIVTDGYITGNNDNFPTANVVFDDAGNVTEFVIDTNNWNVDISSAAYMRFSAQGITTDSIVTVNEEIDAGEDGGAILGHKFASGSFTLSANTTSAYTILTAEELFEAVKDDFPGATDINSLVYGKNTTDFSLALRVFLAGVVWIDNTDVRSATYQTYQLLAGHIYKASLADYTSVVVYANGTSSTAYSIGESTSGPYISSKGFTIGFSGTRKGFAGTKYNWIIWALDHGEVKS